MLRARRSRWWVRWLFRLALVTATLGALEAGFRVLLRARGAPYDAAAVHSSLRARLRAFDGGTFLDRTRSEPRSPEAEKTRHILHPFYGWQTGAGRTKLEARMRETRRLPRNAYLIWIVGGSVAGIFGNPGSGLEPLVERLSDDPRLAGRNVVVHNYARAAYKEPQQLMLVAHLFSLGLEPDAVINIDGFNEVAIGNMNALAGAHPTYPDLTQWGFVAVESDADPRLDDIEASARRLARRARWLGDGVLASGLYRSAVVGWWTERSLGNLAWKHTRLETEYKNRVLSLAGTDTLRGPARGEDRDRFDVIVTSWVESSRALHALCATHSALYLHVLQPTLHDEGSKPLTPEEIQSANISDSWLEGVRVGYPRLRAAAAELRDAGVAFLDASRVFEQASQTLYYDLCHFNAEGNHLLAGRVADAFLAALPARVRPRGH